MTDLPYVIPAGRVVTQPGYDPETRLYLDLDRAWQPVVLERPTAQDVRAALATMMTPWSAYRFAGTDDAAGLVSAVLASVTRLGLDLCPAVLIDAAAPGSGKTKAASALGAVIEGQRPAVTPFAGSTNDDELRKRMVAGAVDGVRFQCVDNLVGHVRSSVLAAVLTTGRLSDRVLGQSRTVTANVRTLLTLTGNNASLDADLQRRTVQIRIDAGAAPTHRAFDFDPVTEALWQRQQIAVAACTVLRAYFNAGAPDVVKGDAGGFADWNRLCRQPVLWLAREGLADGLPWRLGDPAASMLADASASDPELEATGDLLRALWALSEGADFTAADAVAWTAAGDGADADSAFALLRSAVVEVVGRFEVSARSMGRILMNRRERVVSGLRLLKRNGAGHSLRWRVVLIDAGREGG